MVKDEKKHIALAKLAGFKKKKPKKPTGKFSVSKGESFLAKLGAWEKELMQASKEGQKIQALRDKVKKA